MKSSLTVLALFGAAAAAGVVIMLQSPVPGMLYAYMPGGMSDRKNPAVYDLHENLMSSSGYVSCLTPEEAGNVEFECYDLPSAQPVGSEITVTHSSGQSHRVRVFDRGDGHFYRFTPTQLGRWISSDGKEFNVDAVAPQYAKGFVTNIDGRWGRSRTREVFVPQYVMYHLSDISGGVQLFVEQHGFTGFHVPNLRDFLDNPEFFESIVLETYRAGGVTHFWLWGDAQRKQTPRFYEGDVEQLYAEIGRRLGPIPGWTMGFGFDLREWAVDSDIEAFRKALSHETNYQHMVGARGGKQSYKRFFNNVDYRSWEWHRPAYSDYIDHIRKAGDLPSFSEDRFRIREKSRFKKKDYDFELTIRGLWDSFLAGGVANIWGNMDAEGYFSAEYPNTTPIKLYRQIVDEHFSVDMTKRVLLHKGAPCLASSTSAVCVVKGGSRITLSDLSLGTALEVDVYDLLSGQPVDSSVEMAGGELNLPGPDKRSLVIVVKR